MKEIIFVLFSIFTIVISAPKLTKETLDMTKPFWW